MMNRKEKNQLEKQLIEKFSKPEYSEFSKQDAKQIQALLNTYYRYTSIEDIEEENIQDLLGAVIAHWLLLKKRKTSTAMVRAYNPNFEEHGWQSAHTIIEVVTDNFAFLVDSLTMGLNRAGLTIRLTIHPVIKALRDKKGDLLEISEIARGKGNAESIISFQVERQLSSDVLRALEEMILTIVNDIKCANNDWQNMKARVQSVKAEILDQIPPIDQDGLSEIVAFLDWIGGDHFTFLSYCEFDFVAVDGKETLKLLDDSVLGLLRQSKDVNKKIESVIPVLGEQYSKFPCCIVVTKANVKSTVHRPAYMDFIGLKRYNQEGNVIGLHCFLGLFSSSAYNSLPRDIPLLRKKVTEVIESTEISVLSHSNRVLHNILDTYPRDELFQNSTEELLGVVLGILSLQERQRTRLFVTKDIFNRFYSCFIYLPRERFSRELRIRLQKVLVETFQGIEVQFNTLFSESILARIHFVVHCAPDAIIEYDEKELEEKVIEATLTWQDGLDNALIETYGEALAGQYFREYSTSFPGGYREDFHPRTAASDIARIEQAQADNELGLHFYRPIVESADRVHFRLYSVDKPVPLSEAIPILENMGLSVFGERPYQIRHQSGDVWIHDFSMRYAKGAENLTNGAGKLFQEAFLKVWKGDADNDGFNQLVLDARLSWKQVVLLRAYSRYLKQIKIPFSQSYIIETLTRHGDITCLLIGLFNFRFSPEHAYSNVKTEKVLAKIEAILESVSSLDQDQIIRGFINLIQATLRTNYFQTDSAGEAKPYLSFKVDPKMINGMPLPMPMFEIFVFSARMEGVHLRGGKVARGGLRWSDRMEDFRTEVLGLMKAQMVKNTVIVPVGSKGGFIVKRLLDTDNRDEMMKEVIFCYKTLLKGMLDLTDNLSGSEIIPPENVVRHDDNDPYLVIAADKGTATFSDIANGVSNEYGFWLGDAFASGGSAGYDHKKMGITAKGAWESVKRNFRELGVNIQTTNFRVIGIGDMAGDVFGNGMLLSRHIKLVAAFNHMHIFLDPEPDTESSFKERERLFKLPRSSWMDYKKNLISKGGGIFSRNAKFITLSDEVKGMLGIKSDRVRPNELICSILKAQVDLFWNGGIGTYIKAATETNDDVRDKANDALRINGGELRCKVVGEGGNLGLTQLGRIEYAAKGGLVYTDSIDNSAGVDCSDHEVNIKILLGQTLANGDMTQKQRNKLLVQMTDEISDLVLADNYAQAQAISVINSEAPARLYEHARFIDFLEQNGTLNRELEFLPNKKEIADRQAAGKGLTKPEISILLPYSKMTYYEALINSDIPDDPFLLTELIGYFPKVLGEKYYDEMLSHRLKREIISTNLTNSIVDHIGPGFGFRVREEVGVSIAGVTRAYLSASKIFGTDQLWDDIELLDNKVPAAVQIEMMREVARMLHQTVIWILRSRRNNVVIRDLVDYFQDGVAELAEKIPKPLAAKDRLSLNKRIKYFVHAGAPRDIAQRVASVAPLSSALDIVEVARQGDQQVPLVASLYFNLGMMLDFHWLREQIAGLDIQTHWHYLAKNRLIDTLSGYQRKLTAKILKSTKLNKNSKKMMDQWAGANHSPFDRHLQMISELKARTSVDFAMLSVVVAGVDGLLVADI